jgi:hypothetical protein
MKIISKLCNIVKIFLFIFMIIQEKFSFSLKLQAEKKLDLNTLNYKLDNKLNNKLPLLVYDYQKFKLKFLRQFAYFDYSSELLKRLFVFDFFLNFNSVDLNVGGKKNVMNLPNSNNLEQSKRGRFEFCDSNTKETISMYDKFYEYTYNKKCADILKKLMNAIFCDLQKDAYVREVNGKREIIISEYTCLNFLYNCEFEDLPEILEENIKGEDNLSTNLFKNICIEKISTVIPPIGLIRNVLEISDQAGSLNLYDHDCYFNYTSKYNENSANGNKNQVNNLDLSNLNSNKFSFKKHLEYFESSDIMGNSTYSMHKKNFTNLLFNHTRKSENNTQDNLETNYSYKFYGNFLSFLIDYSIIKRDFVNNNIHEIFKNPSNRHNNYKNTTDSNTNQMLNISSKYNYTSEEILLNLVGKLFDSENYRESLEFLGEYKNKNKFYPSSDEESRRFFEVKLF